MIILNSNNRTIAPFIANLVDGQGKPLANENIASNINGCKEAIDDGVNGFLCETRNAENLIEKVEAFLVLPYKEKIQMGKAARKKVEKEFDRQIVVSKYLKEIEQIKS